MPESAIADPPPAKTDPPASLKALFQIPSDLVETPATDDPPPSTKPETPPDKPPDKPEAPPAAEPEAKKSDDITRRLAPDFSKVADDAAPKVDATPDPELAQLDQAIKDAPTEKARIDMGKFRDRYAEFKKENQELKARPAAPAEDPAQQTLVSELTKRAEEAEQRLERFDLMASPKFQREFIQPRAKAFQTAQGIVKEAGGDIALLERAMALGGKARTELLDEIRESIPSEMMRGRFDRQIEAIDAKTAEINERLADSKRAIEESRREETVQSHEQREKQKKQLEGLLGSAIRDLEENLGLEVLHKVGKPDFKWWDDQKDEILSVAREIYLDATPEKAALASVLAASAGPYRSMWQAERDARLAVEAENRELKGADPSITKERVIPKVDAESSDASSILDRLRSGAYRK